MRARAAESSIKTANAEAELARKQQQEQVTQLQAHLLDLQQQLQVAMTDKQLQVSQLPPADCRLEVFTYTCGP